MATILRRSLPRCGAARSDKSIALLQPLATQGNTEAQAMLGSCYQLGLGIDRNLDTAAYWYKLASNQGCGIASSNLATILSTGWQGTAANSEEARLYSKLASEQGFLHSVQ